MFFPWVYLYFVVNIFNESDFCSQELKNINEKKWYIMKFIEFIFWKDKIDYNKIIMYTKKI